MQGCADCGGVNIPPPREDFVTDGIARTDGLVNCNCFWSYAAEAISRGAPDAGAARDIALCLPPELNLTYLRSNDPTNPRIGELEAMSDDEYEHLIEEFCLDQAARHSEAVMQFVQPLACDPPFGLPKQYAVTDCRPVSPAGDPTQRDFPTTFPDPSCELPCQAIECNSTTCPSDEVLITDKEDPDVGIHFDRCECTDLPGCDTLGPSNLCHPPMLFPDVSDTPLPDGVDATTSPLLASNGINATKADRTTNLQATGGLSRWLANPSTARISENSHTRVHVEACDSVLGIPVCVSDSDTADIEGNITIFGGRCREGTCLAAIEAWLVADDINLSFSGPLGLITFEKIDLSKLRLLARANADAVTVDATGNGAVAPFGFRFYATADRDGETRLIWSGTNEIEVPFQVNWERETITIPSLQYEVDPASVTVTLEGSFDGGFLQVDAGEDRIVECDTIGGSQVDLRASGSGSATVGYTWWRHAAFDDANLIPSVEPLGPHAQVFQSLGTTEYHALLAGIDGVARDSAIVRVADTTPPNASVTINPAAAWPPNHKMVRVEPAFEIDDACSDSFITEIAEVVRVADGGRGRVDKRTPDYEVDENGDLWLRAERAGGGTVTYYVTYLITDESGNSSQTTGTVVVPANRGTR